ncbi:MAG: hypothetical protein A3H72_03885 [Candidatus Doudnabacteria bacterium RIFCSPLOWO2_02_FULL_48_8]|uniref:Uncharacterized protein n=1 Tax=Candidatus Doudnabacteria bacterium RIFCSPHIGHO2_01_FULL_46_24 TaxID=1817825 RepID=A0A1F5NVK9_9BACT|nr:MAG: hypothetical protein A2720_02105 [Candidatus Doudnabacteria bacterium RIFCSPHIGHO2_01_FULL_46_24]OGE95145.1 MAG: hypothetical protein A3H72_03885 [Candidatus Doudnabacteria bacterium RIFCSPLOWO2_02_FULL_48_8]
MAFLSAAIKSLYSKTAKSFCQFKNRPWNGAVLVALLAYPVVKFDRLKAALSRSDIKLLLLD